MVEAELLIVKLRSQVRELQALLNDLESRDFVAHEEYAYVHTRLNETIDRLKEVDQFSSQRVQIHRLRAQWLN